MRDAARPEGGTLRCIS